MTGRLRFSRADAFEPAYSNPLFPEIPNVANIKSAKKRAKQTIVRNSRNVAQRSMLRTAVKKVIKALGAHDAKAAQDAFVAAQPLLDRMSARGLIHKNKAARHKSRLTARIKALQAAA